MIPLSFCTRGRGGAVMYRGITSNHVHATKAAADSYLTNIISVINMGLSRQTIVSRRH